MKERKKVVENNKAYIEKRNEILKTAEILFGRKGYEKCSVNNILEEVGIAKGTFYYYFKSKEEVLDAIIERITDMAVDRAKRVSEDSSLSPLEKLVRVFSAINVEDQVEEQFKQRIHEPQNAIVHQKSLTQSIIRLTPILEDIVEEGIRQGIFTSDFPKQYIQILLTASITLLDGEIFSLSQEERYLLMQALMSLGEKMFGLPQGIFLKEK